MADNIQMPSSGGGIVRYNDAHTSKFSIQPKVVLVLIAVVIVAALIAHFTL